MLKVTHRHNFSILTRDWCGGIDIFHNIEKQTLDAVDSLSEGLDTETASQLAQRQHFLLGVVVLRLAGNSQRLAQAAFPLVFVGRRPHLLQEVSQVIVDVLVFSFLKIQT